MKYIILSALSLIATAANADYPASGLYCHSTNVADAGFNLNYRAFKDKAFLSGNSFAGEDEIGTMECIDLPQYMNASVEDPYTFARCSLSIAPDAGYVVTLTRTMDPVTGKFVHTAEVMTTAVVKGEVIELPAEFGNLSCQLN